jgi:hypothetical protein
MGSWVRSKWGRWSALMIALWSLWALWRQKREIAALIQERARII